MCFISCQGADYVSETAQTLIDGLSFLQSITCCTAVEMVKFLLLVSSQSIPRMCKPLWSSKVNQVKNSVRFLRCAFIGATQMQWKHRMWAWWLGICVGCTASSISISFVNDTFHLIWHCTDHWVIDYVCMKQVNTCSIELIRTVFKCVTFVVPSELCLISNFWPEFAFSRSRIVSL